MGIPCTSFQMLERLQMCMALRKRPRGNIVHSEIPVGEHSESKYSKTVSEQEVSFTS